MKYKKYWRKTSLKQKGIGDLFLNEILLSSPKKFLEIGVFQGVTARNICELLYKIHNNNFKYIGVDKFDLDYKTSMGYMKNSGKVLNSRNHPNYESIIAFNPIIDNIPEFYIYDTDEVSLDTIINQYDSVIENLRLIKRPGINRWPKQDKRWSEIAIGQDIHNNIIIIYCSSILSMFELNEILLSLPIELQVAQHLEGNTLAQLYLNTGTYEINHDNNLYVPNLIGVKIKSDD